MKEIIKNVIKDFNTRGPPKFVERSIKVPLESNKIVSIIGPRRAGKTYLMFQLISKIDDIENVIYINFEDERLELDSNDVNYFGFRSVLNPKRLVLSLQSGVMFPVCLSA